MSQVLPAVMRAHDPEAPMLFMALARYVHANIDFVDAYNVFHMKYPHTRTS